VLLFVVVGLLIWIAVSVAVGPLLGAALRGCEVEELRNSVPVLRAKAQHPSSQAA